MNNFDRLQIPKMVSSINYKKIIWAKLEQEQKQEPYQNPNGTLIPLKKVEYFVDYFKKHGGYGTETNENWYANLWFKKLLIYLKTDKIEFD